MTTGLAVFDTTVQESNEWLREIERLLQPCDRQQAYGALRGVLHTVRDRLPPDGVAGLSAQLPMLLRGLFLEGWKPGQEASDIRDPQAFASRVQSALPPGFPREPTATITAVLQVIVHRVDPGEVAKLVHYLPASLRGFWPAAYATA